MRKFLFPRIHGPDYDLCIRSMANNITQLQFSSVMICDVSRVYIPTELKTIAIQATVAIITIFISLFGTLANCLVIMAYYRNPRLRTI